MAPRRHNSHGHGGSGEVQGLLGIDHEPSSTSSSIGGHNLDSPSSTSSVFRCCVPTGECLRASAMAGNPNNNDYVLISMDDLRDTVRVTCNNDNCTMGKYMHRECFEAWEQSVLTYLKSCGRARSWSERQRLQNLWTKKGYDLAFKACGCKCGRGHLKKDLDWIPPPPTSGVFRTDDADSSAKKKKRRNRNNTRPTVTISGHPQYHPNSNNQSRELQQIMSNGNGNGEARGRTASLSSSTGSSSPPVSGASESSVSPAHSGGAKKKSRFDFFSDRVR